MKGNRRLRAPSPAPSAHHLVKFIYLQCRIEGITLEELAQRSGVARSCIGCVMRGKGTMKMDNVEALLGVFGYTTKPVRIS